MVTFLLKDLVGDGSHGWGWTIDSYLGMNNRHVRWLTCGLGFVYHIFSEFQKASLLKRLNSKRDLEQFKIFSTKTRSFSPKVDAFCNSENIWSNNPQPFFFSNEQFGRFAGTIFAWRSQLYGNVLGDFQKLWRIHFESIFLVRETQVSLLRGINGVVEQFSWDAIYCSAARKMGRTSRIWFDDAPRLRIRAFKKKFGKQNYRVAP